jgi:hypothetical protein
MIDFYLSDNFPIWKSKKYENIYDVLVNKKHLFKMSELFTLCATIGFKNGTKLPIVKRGTEMRSEHFRKDCLPVVYSMIVNDPCIGGDIDKFEDYEFIKSAFKKIEEYAEGGLQILHQEVFEDKWDGSSLDEEYDEYEIDILRYVYDEQNKEIF